MVKIFFLLFLFLRTISLAEDIDSMQDAIVVEDPLTSKIRSFLDEKTYVNNKEFISVIFEPQSAFYKNNKVDAVKVIATLKENGLLKLFFDKPRELKLNFKTSGPPLFFVKLMSDTLRNIGYYRYVTTASNLDLSEFTWNISLKSEYVTDPLILEKELNKSACKIIDIQRDAINEWTYVIDMQEGTLNIESLVAGEQIHLKRSLYAHWLNVSKIKSLKIKSSRRNRWYPYIAYYDASLHLLALVKNTHIVYAIELSIPQNAKFIKISDRYTLKNVRDELLLLPSETK